MKATWYEDIKTDHVKRKLQEDKQENDEGEEDMGTYKNTGAQEMRNK